MFGRFAARKLFLAVSVTVYNYIICNFAHNIN